MCNSRLSVWSPESTGVLQLLLRSLTVQRSFRGSQCVCPNHLVQGLVKERSEDLCKLVEYATKLQKNKLIKRIFLDRIASPFDCSRVWICVNTVSIYAITSKWINIHNSVVLELNVGLLLQIYCSSRIRMPFPRITLKKCFQIITDAAKQCASINQSSIAASECNPTYKLSRI